MHRLWNDLGYTWRQLRRSPGFAFTVVLTLALGVGANAIAFSVLNVLIFHPLDLPEAAQLVSINRLGNVGNTVPSSPAHSYPDYRDVRDMNRTFSGIAAYSIERAGVGIAGAVHQGWFYEASENYFDVLRVQPAVGRFFHPADAHGPNSAPYAVLSYGYWLRQFHGDPHVAGTVIELNKHPFTILGVAPASFRGTELFFSADFWVPLSNRQELNGEDFTEARGNHNISLVGRLKPGASAEQASSDLNAIGKELAGRNPQDADLGFRLSRPGLLGDTLRRPVQAFLLGVMVLTMLLLLAACANLGSLFAARAADRARELALRLALGATRGRLMRQLVAEAVVVSIFGGLAGLALASAVLRALSAWHPSPDFPIAFMLKPDGSVLAVALTLAVVSGVFLGMVPARQVCSKDVYLAMKSGPTVSTSGRRWTLRDGLLVLQVVLCSVLLTASLVAVRGLVRSLHASYGFQPEGVTLASFDLLMSGQTDKQALAIQHRALDAAAALPGVTAAGFADKIPLSLSTSDSNVYRYGVTDFRDAYAAADASLYNVSPGYLAAAGTRLVSGRDFTWNDKEEAPPVAIVNKTFASRVFGTADGVGHYFTRGGPRIQVVGVVEDGKYNTLTEDATAAMFLPYAQSPDTPAILVVRSQAGEAATARGIEDALGKLEPGLPLTINSWPRSMTMVLLPSVAATVALGIMGGLAGVLAVTGIFGMASYAVSRRMRELGLRVALGATRQQVLAAALGRPARLLLVGSGAGLLLGAATSRLLAHVVYQATSQDPVVLGGVVGCMALLALIATWLPVLRVLHVDPAALLREE